MSKIFHPAIGEIYCLNAPEARATVHEICNDRIYFQSGVSIAPGDVVLDIGANIGVFTLCAAKLGGRVYAYEPVPPTFAVLEQNVQSQGLQNVVQTRNLGLADRAGEKMMFHYPALSVCDAWTAQDDLFKHLSEPWENTLEILKRADPDQYNTIRSLESRSKQQAAVRDWMESVSASVVQIKCRFCTLSDVIAQEKLESIDLLKLDAELADWEILNGVIADDWQRIRQLAMEVHVPSEVSAISQFLRERGFQHVASSQLKIGTSSLWAIRRIGRRSSSNV
jgi:FkbM family methyltransferase